MVKLAPQSHNSLPAVQLASAGNADPVYLWTTALVTMGRTVVWQILLPRVRQRLDPKDEMVSVQVTRCLCAELVVGGRGKGQGYGPLTVPLLLTHTNYSDWACVFKETNKKGFFLYTPPPRPPVFKEDNKDN